MNAGDSLYVSEPEEMINETIIETYFWGARETNHLVYSYNFTSEDDYSYLSVDMFWDKEIGVVTELSFFADAYINGTIIDASAEWLITDSNILEDIPEFSRLTFILMIIIASFSIVFVKISRYKNGNA